MMIVIIISILHVSSSSCDVLKLNHSCSCFVSILLLLLSFLNMTVWFSRGMRKMIMMIEEKVLENMLWDIIVISSFFVHLSSIDISSTRIPKRERERENRLYSTRVTPVGIRMIRRASFHSFFCFLQFPCLTFQA